MKGLKILSFCCIFSFFFISYAEEVILQNGLNGYTGCEDAWVFGAYYDRTQRDKNFGNDSKLTVFYGRDGSAMRGST